MRAILEHANITVPDPKASAAILCELFGWQVRWEGEAIHDGYTVHVGGEGSYLALYSPGKGNTDAAARYSHRGGLNHIGIVVEDLAAMETRVREAGYDPHSHADYEPGKRFYFDGPDEIEFELVQYD